MFGAPPTSTVVRNLVLVCVAGFVLQGLSRFSVQNDQLMAWGGLIPVAVWRYGQAWRLVSYIFLHADFLHIFFNMYGLWVFGQPVAHRLGDRKFLALFLFSGIFGGLFSGLFYLIGGAAYNPVIGASGAVFGVMLACAKFFPDSLMTMYFIPIRARTAIWILGGLALYSSFVGTGNVANLTHLFGLLGGWLFLQFDERVEMWFHALVKRGERKRIAKATEVLQDREEFFDTRVDPILKKISKHGMDSLTRQERIILEKASGMRKESDNLVDLKAWKYERGR